jgi:hypothetical protein
LAVQVAPYRLPTARLLTGTSSAGVWVHGWGRTITRVVPAFDQFNWNGVTYNGKNCLFGWHGGINFGQLMIWGAGYQNTGMNTAVIFTFAIDSNVYQFANFNKLLAEYKT